MKNIINNTFSAIFAENASNRIDPTPDAIRQGIGFKQDINSPQPNGFFYKISQAIQFMQFTGTLYSSTADYDENNVCSLITYETASSQYKIKWFRRNSNNALVLNNNPPILQAQITTINNVDIYADGDLNPDWDKLNDYESIDVEPYNLIRRDKEGAGQVNMPQSILDTSIINYKYAKELITLMGVIPLYFTVYPEDDGSFDDRKRPANYFKNLYGIETEWIKRFADTGAFFRVEGGLANEKRTSLVQPFAIINANGSFIAYHYITVNPQYSGFFRKQFNNQLKLTGTVVGGGVPGFMDGSVFWSVDNFSAYKNNISTEIRPNNILIEIYELYSLNGKVIFDDTTETK